ncbi:unnamed protein product [Enterobius vermicularis]|uniref:Ig-like domain-containing protein n=1 Tax=Enterobius vermicularis TaxID=51028 RepID=A0A0N4V1U8_ENTVE|nr:unnamed protein product [Enterobius vermicularis]
MVIPIADSLSDDKYWEKEKGVNVLHKRRVSVEEELDDDVSRISVKPGCTMFKSILIRVILAVLFVAVGVGAVAYSVFNAEKHDDSDVLIEKFNIYLDQQCLNGTILIEYGSYQCSPAGHCYNITNVTDRMITWEQDNNNKKLKISFGENEESILLISNLTIQRDKRSDNATNYNCTVIKDSYDDFLRKLCLNNLKRSMSDPLVTIDGIAVRKYNGSGSCQVENQTVYIEAYSRQDGTVFGWDVFFNVSTPLRRLRYRFPSMMLHTSSFTLENTC